VHPSGSPLYVTNRNDDITSFLTLIDTATNTVLSTTPVGSSPRGVAVNPAGTFVYTANAGAGTVSVLSATGSPIATIPVGSSPQDVAVHPDGSRVYVTTQDGLFVIDAGSNTVVTAIPRGPLDRFLNGIAIGPDATTPTTTSTTTTTTTLPTPLVRIQGPTKAWVKKKASIVSPNHTVTLQAVGTPGGGTYSWFVAAGKKLVKVEGTTSSDTLNLRGKKPSKAPQDVTVQVDYTVSGQTVSATHTLTLVRPQYLCQCDPTIVPIPPTAACGPGELGGRTYVPGFEDPSHRSETWFFYATVDQFRERLRPSDFGAPPMRLREKVSRFRSNYPWLLCPRSDRDITTPANGSAFFSDMLFQDCPALPANPEDLATTARQTLWVEGWEVSARDLTFFAQSVLSQETKPKNLCPVMVHP
jgi:YVTN family beta-propeller protein